MNKQTYKSMLFESLVDFGNMQTFKSPADKVLETVKKGNMDDFEPTRDACDEIAVLGRVYDARDNDRPIIREDDEEGDAQGDIDIDAKDIDLTAKEDDMSDFSGNDAGAMPNATKTDEFDDVIMDEGVFLGEDDEEMDDDEDTDDDDEDDEGIEEDDEEMDDDENIDEVEDDEDDDTDEVEEDDIMHDDTASEEDDPADDPNEEDDTNDEVEEDDEDGDGTCPECGKDPCECDDDEDDEEDEDDDLRDKPLGRGFLGIFHTLPSSHLI